VVAPPEPEVANFVAGSALLSNDGRLLAVAAESKHPSSAVTSPQQVIVGYLYKVVAQPYSQHAFRYQLAEQLTVSLNDNSTENNGQSSTGKVLFTRAHLSMAPDGKTIVACWTTGRQQGAALSTSHAAAAGEYPHFVSGGAAVFSWRGYGQTLQVTQLTAPKGEAQRTCTATMMVSNDLTVLQQLMPNLMHPCSHDWNTLVCQIVSSSRNTKVRV